MGQTRLAIDDKDGIRTRTVRDAHERAHIAGDLHSVQDQHDRLIVEREVLQSPLLHSTDRDDAVRFVLLRDLAKHLFADRVDLFCDGERPLDERDALVRIDAFGRDEESLELEPVVQRERCEPKALHHEEL